MSNLSDLIKKRQKHDKKTQKEFSVLLKSQGLTLTMEYRQQKLQQTITSFNTHPIIQTFHEYEEELQKMIDSILLDQRCKSGQKILKLYEAIKATEIDEIPPHEIVDYLQDFVDQTANEFSIHDDFLDILRLSVGRAVYPMIFPFLWEFHFDQNENLDQQFEKQQKILRTVPPGSLDSVLEPFSSDLSLFEKGISILEDLIFQNVIFISLFYVFLFIYYYLGSC